MARNRGNSVLVFVTIGTTKYGFAAGAGSTPHRSALGHTIFADQAGVVFGANSPKPNRASFEETSGETVSSYCDGSKEASLKAAGWIITRNSRRRGLVQSARSASVYVPMPGGYNYAWNITRAELDLAGDLGFQLAAGSTPNLVWGSKPKPPRATKILAGSRVSTFIQPRQSIIDAAIDEGYTITGINYDLIPET